MKSYALILCERDAWRVFPCANLSYKSPACRWCNLFFSEQNTQGQLQVPRMFIERTRKDQLATDQREAAESSWFLPRRIPVSCPNLLLSLSIPIWQRWYFYHGDRTLLIFGRLRTAKWQDRRPHSGDIFGCVKQPVCLCELTQQLSRMLIDELQHSERCSTQIFLKRQG